MGNQPTEDKNARRIKLCDGRQLVFTEYGAVDGRPVIALHGTPGSRLKFSIGHKTAQRLGLRLIAPDRWGYAASQAPRNANLAAYGDDIAELLAQLKITPPIGVFGISGGGPFAAAVGARLGDRVGALALAAPVGPIAGAAKLADTGAFHAFCFRVLPFLPGATRVVFAGFRRVLKLNPALGVRLASLRAARVDREILADPPARDGLGKAFWTGLENSVDGTVIDLKVFGSRWDFDVASICAPTRVWLGRRDTHVPLAPARALASSVQNGSLVDIPDAGHFWVVPNHGEILAWLSQSLRS